MRGEVVQILRHIVVEIIFLGLLVAVVPVGVRIYRQRLTFTQPLAHLAYAEQHTVLIGHPGIKRRIHPQPFAHAAAPHHRYHMAVAIGVVGTRLTSDEARRPPHGHIQLRQHVGEPTAVESALLLHTGFIQVYGIMRRSIRISS